MKNNTNISKYLSYILRHKPESIGLVLDNNGWADIDELIDKTTEFTLTRDQIKQIAKESDKQRFTINQNKIRANQGHSINIDLGLNTSTPPEYLYHGTATRFLDSILQGGLTPKERQHVHLSPDVQTAKKVGQRHGKPIALRINALLMDKQGYRFFISDNGVWLTESVPTEFIEVIEE